MRHRLVVGAGGALDPGGLPRAVPGRVTTSGRASAVATGGLMASRFLALGRGGSAVGGGLGLDDVLGLGRGRPASSST